MQKASDLAATSECNQKHGAIIIRGGRVLATAINRTRNNPNNVADPKTQAAYHAEVAALMACPDVDLKNATIYVARVNNSGEQMMSKPCVNCQAALKARGVKKIFYTIDKSIDL